MDQGNLAGFGLDYEHVVGQQELAMAIAAVLPTALDGSQVETDKDPLVEPVNVSFPPNNAGELGTEMKVLPARANHYRAMTVVQVQQRAPLAVTRREKNRVARSQIASHNDAGLAYVVLFRRVADPGIAPEHAAVGGMIALLRPSPRPNQQSRQCPPHEAAVSYRLLCRHRRPD